MTSMSSPRIKKSGLVSKSYRMSRPGLGCKMAGGYITTAWEKKHIMTTLNGKTVKFFLGKKPMLLADHVEKIILSGRSVLWTRRRIQRWKTTDLSTCSAFAKPNLELWLAFGSKRVYPQLLASSSKESQLSSVQLNS